MTNPVYWRHMPVYLPGGRLLGRLEEVSHAADLLHVQQGRRIVRDWYVPASAIARVGSDGVFLTTTIATMRSRGWNVPPVEYLLQQGATPGYEYTSASDARTYRTEALAGEDAG